MASSTALFSAEDLFRHSPNAYMVLDRALRYIDANPAYEQLVGVPREQLVGRGLFEVFPGDVGEEGTAQADVLRASLERVLATGERDVLALIPYRVDSSDTTSVAPRPRYWSATHTPLRDAEGRVVAVMQHTTDVSEVVHLRKSLREANEGAAPTRAQLAGGVMERAASVQQANLRLSAQQAFLADLFAQAPGFMAVLRGPDYVFEMANAAYERLVRRSGLVGLTVREALPEVEGQGFMQLLDQVRLSARPFVGRGMRVTLRDDDGSDRIAHVDFVYQPVLDAAGQVEAIFVQGADVSDRESLLDALRESETRFRTIANLVPQMIWSTLPDGAHDFYNQRWYDFTGVPEGSTDGDAWSGVFHPDDQPRAWERWRHSLATGEPYEIEYRLRHHSGEYRWVLGLALPIRDAEARIVRWMGTCTDIDERKRMRERLERSEKALLANDRHKDQFLATLAHELRNPLAPIANAVQLLKMAPERVDTVRRAAAIIERQAAHMGYLVNDLMDVSRVTRGLITLQRRPVELGPLIAAAIEQSAPLMTRHGHRLEVLDHGAGLRVDADPTRLVQILANLLNNAAKYTPAGGRVTIEAAREDDHAVVRVHDTGIGMDAALIDRVFEVFAQAETAPERHEGGLGIGLSLARSLAELHGGSLVAHSPGPGQGSTFEVRLPVHAEAVAPA